MACEVQDYLDRVGERIRWARGRTYLLRELSDHIEDQRSAFEAQGLPPEEALRRAVAEMGDPEEVGDALNALHRPGRSWAPALCALSAGGLGALCVLTGLSAGEPVSHLLSLALGLAAMLLLRLMDLGRVSAALGRGALPLAMALALLTYVFIEAAPIAAGGAHGGFAPLLLVLSLFSPALFALVLLRLRGVHGFWLWALSPLMYLLAAPAAVYPSLVTALFLGGAMLLTASAAVCLGWFQGPKWVGLVSLWAPTAGLTGLALSLFPHLTRWTAFLHPQADPAGSGWFFLLLRRMLWQGEAEAAAQYLQATGWSGDPQFSLLTLSAQLGRPVMLLALGAVLLFGAVCLWRVRRLHSASGKLLAHSLFWPLFLQAAGSWLCNAGLSPFFMALPFPFFSYGPWAMGVDFALLGLLLSLFRMDPLLRDGPAPVRQPFSLRALLLPPLEEG
ncbi:MAG TPA: hypothetical protein H9714_01515 [Candidatus Flavonifractor intestinipullorum]|uniref:Cell division protein FtsW n=1 Tax=Candidatus Flavonifractor intestinipullorum TaxID=2838587 RepID=A0A9D2M9R4_9FIRM|nr:hypothetical protein [Candidatus Flavonifractor intestinipullorum]